MKYFIRVPNDDLNWLNSIEKDTYHHQHHEESIIFKQLQNSPAQPAATKSLTTVVPNLSREWEMKNNSYQRHHQVEEDEEKNNSRQNSSILENNGGDRHHRYHEEQRERARCEWDFNLSITISSPSSANSSASDAIGVLEFDETNNFLATGGIARKIRIYNADKSLRNDSSKTTVLSVDHASACEFYICTPAKLSSLKWRPGLGSRVVGSGDYDGVIMEYDLEKRVPVFERDEHGGRKVWSMDYARWDPTLGASGSDDGSMQLWDPRCDDIAGKTLGRVRPNPVSSSPVCSVEFDPSGGPYIIAGCADRRIYNYDVRMMVDPVFILDGHEKAVTYAKFLDQQTIISSSVDGSMMMWHTGNTERPVRTYNGHVNSRRFVGLSVWRSGGLLSCGSEDNRVFVYDKRWGEPIWSHGLDPVARPRGEQGFVSAVSWREMGHDENRCMLVAGGSDGVLQVYEGERKTITFIN